MKYDILTFGSATLDVFVKSPEIKIIDSPKSITHRLLTLPYGIKAETSDIVIASGGGGTNTAVGLSRLGLKTAVVTRFGWDLAGKLIRSELKKDKVSEEFINQFEGESSDWTIALIGPDGNRTMLVCRGDTRLEKSLIDFKKINSFWFYIASLEGNLDLLSELVAFARGSHIKIALNPGKKEIESKQALLQIAKKVDVFMVNEQEAGWLTDISLSGEKAAVLLADLLPQVTTVVTKGESGVVAFNHSRKITLPGVKVNQVDQTGAGDAFGSGFVGGLAKGLPVRQSLLQGIINGASVVTKVGAKAGLLKPAEIEQFY